MPTLNPTAAPTAEVHLKLQSEFSVESLSCDDYGSDEEEVFQTAISDVLTDIEVEHFSNSTCAESTGRRLGAASDHNRRLSSSVDISMTLQITSHSTSSSSSGDLATLLNSNINSAVSDGTLDSLIVAYATDYGVGNLLSVSVSSRCTIYRAIAEQSQSTSLCFS